MVSMTPTLFLDRDGIINVDHAYVFRQENFHFVDGIFELVAAAKEAGFLVVVVTNQSGIGRGYFAEEAMHAFHAEMQAQLAQLGGRIDAFYFAPHHEDAAIETYRVVDHPDRKPNPGMLLRAMADHNIDPAKSFMIGDQPSDMEAARRAGVPGFRFEGGDLYQFVRELLGH